MRDSFSDALEKMYKSDGTSEYKNSEKMEKDTLKIKDISTGEDTDVIVENSPKENFFEGKYFDELRESNELSEDSPFSIPDKEEIISIINREKLSLQEKEIYFTLKDTVPYKSGDAADFLNISKPTLIYYTDEFDKILHIERTESGHRILYKRDIVRIGRIIQFKNKFRFSREQVKDYLLEGGNSVYVQPPEELMKDFLNHFIEKMDERLGATTTALLELQKPENNKTIQYLEDKLKERDDLIEQLIEENNKVRAEMRETRESMNNAVELLNKKTQKRSWFGLKK